jgi:hypothetical protein
VLTLLTLVQANIAISNVLRYHMRDYWALLQSPGLVLVLVVTMLWMCKNYSRKPPLRHHTVPDLATTHCHGTSVWHIAYCKSFMSMSWSRTGLEQLSYPLSPTASSILSRHRLHLSQLYSIKAELA